MGTLIVGLLIIGAVALAIRSMARDKKTENRCTAAAIADAAADAIKNMAFKAAERERA